MKHSIVRETIIETASNLFYKKGYNLTGINEIISEAGIAKATLYNHFKSKDDICLAYLDHRNAIFLSQVNSFISKAPKGKKQILGIFDFLFAFFGEEDFNGCSCLNTIAEIPKDEEKIRGEIQAQKEYFLKLIEDVVKKNFPNESEEKNRILSKQVYVLYEGALSECRLHKNDWPIQSARDLCEKILV